MRRNFAIGLVAAALCLTTPGGAQTVFPTPQGNQNAPGAVLMCATQAGVYVPCSTPGAMPLPVVISPTGPVAPPGYPANSYPITGNSTGTTGAVVGTLAARPGATTYICGFNVSAIGGTAAVGPITIAGLITASMVYQLASTASGNMVTQTFTPCIPASAVNTAITITTTADGSASGVDVNSWGFQL